MNHPGRLLAKFCAYLALLLAATHAAHAVILNPRGTGQVLLYPYYTINANNATLLAIVNSTAHAKALRVRIARADDGSDAASFNLYLAPYDVWTAGIFLGSTAPLDPVAPAVMITTNDKSCTVPAINTASFFIGGGVLVSTQAGAFEGSVEVIEMGTLIDGSPSARALTPINGVPQNCQALVDAWLAPVDPGSPSGYWSANPSTDLVNPTGGLFGSGAVVNVEQGTIFQYAAEAIDDFRADPQDQPRGTRASVVMHTAPGSTRPWLADALTDPINGIATANVIANGTLVTANYPAPAQAIDAVSAVLTATTLSNEYLTDPGLGATTDWILDFPTRRFYSDPAIVGQNPIPPFTELFGAPGNQHTDISFVIFDRNGGGSACDLGVCPLLTDPGTAVEVLVFGMPTADQLGSGFGAAFGGEPLPPLTAGWALLGLGGAASPLSGVGPDRFMRASADHKRFEGLPIIGFAVQDIVNANVQSGVLANYSSTVAHRTTTICLAEDPSNPQNIAGACH